MKATPESLATGRADFVNADPFKYKKKTKAFQVDHSDGAKETKATQR